MLFKQLFRFIAVDPINLSIKNKLWAVLACFNAILLVAWLSRHLFSDPAYPLLVASMGASAVILFIMPSSPLAQPWPFFGGQLVSAWVGVFSAQHISDQALASACAVGGSVMAMLVLRCLHPPGAATAIAPVIGGEALAKLAYGFVLTPVAVNAIIMLVMAIIINRWLLRYPYPSLPTPLANKQTQKNLERAQVQQTGFSVQELQQVLQNQKVYVDVTPGDLSKIIQEVQQQSVKRWIGNISCADIMSRDVATVEYGTEVEEAWQVMHSHRLKAMPVLDKARRVIGIISWNDFFNCLDETGQGGFQAKFCAFIKRTADISTAKPEAVGHIMTSPVQVLSENAHIVDLIPLMSDRNFGHVPIVNHENRLVGMIDQANLIATIYSQQLLKARN